MRSRSSARSVLTLAAAAALALRATVAGAQPSQYMTYQTDVTRGGATSTLRPCVSNAILRFPIGYPQYVDCASFLSGPYSTTANDFTSLLIGSSANFSPTPGSLVPKSTADSRITFDGFTGDAFQQDVHFGLFDQVSWAKTSPIASIGFWPVIDVTLTAGPLTGNPDVLLSMTSAIAGYRDPYYQSAPGCFGYGPQISAPTSGTYMQTVGTPIVCGPTDQTATDFLLGYGFFTNLSLRVVNPTPLQPGTVCGSGPSPSSPPECSGISGFVHIDMTNSAYLGGLSLYDAQGNDITATAWSDLRSTGGASYPAGKPNLGPTEPPPTTATPEPATVLLLGAGLGAFALGGLARRRLA